MILLWPVIFFLIGWAVLHCIVGDAAKAIAGARARANEREIIRQRSQEKQ